MIPYVAWRPIGIEDGYCRLYAEDAGCCSTINGSVAVVQAAPALLTWKLTYRLYCSHSTVPYAWSRPCAGPDGFAGRKMRSSDSSAFRGEAGRLFQINDGTPTAYNKPKVLTTRLTVRLCPMQSRFGGLLLSTELYFIFTRILRFISVPLNMQAVKTRLSGERHGALVRPCLP